MTDEAAENNKMKPGALISDQIQRGLDSFRDSLPSESMHTDPRSLSDAFAVKISRSIYFDDGEVFVFRAGPRVTNIQYAELLSLIPAHSTSLADPEARPSIQFHSTSEIRSTLENLWNSIVPDRESMKKLLNSDDEFDTFSATVRTSFAPLAACTFIVDLFQCSAVVFAPPTISTDYETLVRHSGYIHSYGKLIYVRNTEKTSIDEFRQNFKSFIDSQSNLRDRQIPFAFYAHEIFDTFESKAEKSDTAAGIGNLKFFAEKYFFGGRPVYSFRDAIESDKSISEKVKFITSEKSYTAQIREIRNRYSGTIWFFRDCKLFRSEETYFLCYHQILMNDDTFIKFDEDKPGWIAPVTLPHTLASAMLSLARPYFALDSSISVVDPFVGSGTTYFEAEKKFARPVFFGGDLCLASRQVIKDNGDILLHPEKYIDCTIEPLAELIDGEEALANFERRFSEILSQAQGRWIKEKRFGPKEWAEEALYQAGQISDSVTMRGPNSNSDPHVNVRRLREHDFGSNLKHEVFINLRERLLLYCYWKVVSKNAPAFLEGRANVTDKLFTEISDLISRLRSLCGLRNSAENYSPNLFTTPVRADYSQIDVHSTDTRLKFRTGPKNGEFSEFSNYLNQNLQESGADIIIMDPPYGFNTDNSGALELLDLYERLVKQVVACAGKQTHLLMCLPEKSHNGQILPSFVTKAWFLPMLLNEAALQNVEIVNAARIWPGTDGFLRAPYYWKSEKALTRSVLHVILRRD